MGSSNQVSATADNAERSQYNRQSRKGEQMRRSTHILGDTLRAMRKTRGWSQQGLALQAGLNRDYVGELERGAAQPSLLTLEKLAAAFGCTVSSLLAVLEQQHDRYRLTAADASGATGYSMLKNP